MTPRAWFLLVGFLMAVVVAGCTNATQSDTFCVTEEPARPSQPGTAEWLFANDRKLFDWIISVNRYGEARCGWKP